MSDFLLSIVSAETLRWTGLIALALALVGQVIEIYRPMARRFVSNQLFVTAITVSTDKPMLASKAVGTKKIVLSNPPPFGRPISAKSNCAVLVRVWHKCEVPRCPLFGRCWGQIGQHLLAVSFSHFDP